MGLSGERHVGQVLARELPQEYALINGLKLPRGAGDIDHLVVGPTGVFLRRDQDDGRPHRVRARRHLETDEDRPRRDARTPRISAIRRPRSSATSSPSATACGNACPACLDARRCGSKDWSSFPTRGPSCRPTYSRVPAMRLDQAASHICLHVPQRALQPDEVEHVVDALLVEGNERAPRPLHQRPECAGAGRGGAGVAGRPGAVVRYARPEPVGSGADRARRRSPMRRLAPARWAVAQPTPSIACSAGLTWSHRAWVSIRARSSSPGTSRRLRPTAGTSWPASGTGSTLATCR